MLYLALIAWCLTLLVVRALASGTAMYFFLAWNLVLAAVPLIASHVGLRRRQSPWRFEIFWLAVWLLFLPNAPYLLTDFVHFRARPPVPLWYDLALLLSCAGTGLVFAYASVARVQSFIAARYGAIAGWSTAIASLILSAFGMYLGRYLRWNSWDVLINPLALLTDVFVRIVSPHGHLRTVGVTAVFGGMLVLGYLALRGLALAPTRER